MARVFVRNSKKGLQVWWEVNTFHQPRRRFPTGVFLSGKKKEQREVLVNELDMCKRFEEIISERDPLSMSTDDTPLPELPVYSGAVLYDFIDKKLASVGQGVLASAYKKLYIFLEMHGYTKLSIGEFAESVRDEFLNWLQEVVRLNTARGYFTALNMAFDDFTAKNESPVNPFAMTELQRKKFFNKVEPKTELDIFTQEQLKELCNSDDKEIADLTKVTFLCYGRRLSEIVELRWKDIDMDNRVITFNTFKTGVVSKVYIGDMLMRVLKSIPKDREKLFNGSRTAYSTFFGKHLMLCGMTKPKGKNERKPLSHHAIRRTVLTLLTDKFDHDRAELLVGHVGRTCGMRHYYKAQIGLYKEATEFLEQYIS